MTATTDTFAYDPFSYASHIDPYPSYAILRDRRPVYRNEEHGFWALSRFADVQAALRDWRSFSSAAGVELDGSFGPGSFIDLDPPRHDELRRILQPAFTPRSVAASTQLVERVAASLVSDWAPGQDVDLAADFALRFPVTVASHLLGLPAGDQRFLERIAASVIVRDADDPTIPPVAQAAAEELREYLERQLAARRTDPGEDWLGLTLTAEADGRLHREETLSFAFLMFVATTETTAGFTATSLELLARHPAERRKLQQDWTLLKPAVEELLRYEAPVQNLSRVTTCDVTVGDTTIPAGERVLLLYGSANRDERRFERPDALDVAREPLRNLAFGEGIHHCLGAPLARLEAQVAVRLLLTEFPDYEITGERVPIHTHTTRAVASLPARL